MNPLISRPLTTLSLLAILAASGCRITNLPNGDNYKSPIAQTTIRLAMDETFGQLELPGVKGKKVSVTSIGFDASQADSREYLRHAAGQSIIQNGGQLVANDAELQLTLIVNACGADHATNYILPIWMGTEERATLDVVLQLDRADGTTVYRETRVSNAIYIESRWIVIIETPGHYQIKRDGKWYLVEDLSKDWGGMFDIPLSGSTGKAGS